MGRLVSLLGLTTTTELRMAFWALLAVAIAGSYIYTHHAGYEECRKPEVAAQKAQKAADTAIDQGVTHENQQATGALTAPGGVASTPPPRIVVRNTGCVPARPATATAGPVAPPTSGSDQGVPGGTQAEPAVDYGPVVQDFALSGLLRASQGDGLWERDVKQSQPLPKVPK